MSVLTRMAGLTDDEYRLALEYRATRLACLDANGVVDDAALGVWLSTGPMGAHAAPVLYADRIEWLGEGVPLSSGLSAKVRRPRKAMFVPDCEPSANDVDCTFQLELRVENPSLGGLFIEHFKSEEERNLDRFCQRVDLEKANGEAAAAARREAVEHAERDRDYWAAEAEAAKARLSSLSTGQMIAVGAWVRAAFAASGAGDVFVQRSRELISDLLARLGWPGPNGTSNASSEGAHGAGPLRDAKPGSKQ
jgi:hypothetical protein